MKEKKYNYFIFHLPLDQVKETEKSDFTDKGWAFTIDKRIWFYTQRVLINKNKNYYSIVVVKNWLYHSVRPSSIKGFWNRTGYQLQKEYNQFKKEIK